MKQEDYRACMAEGLRDKKGLSKEERQRLFCVQSLLCSEKAKSEEEAIGICSQPKPPKAKRTAKICTPESIASLTQCLIQNTDFTSTNPLEKALQDSLIKCMCDKRDSRKKKTAEEKVKAAMTAMDPSQRATFEQMIAENWYKQHAV